MVKHQTIIIFYLCNSWLILALSADEKPAFGEIATEIAVVQSSETAPVPKSDPYDRPSRAMQISIRHSQGSGIGYGRGYTTLEGFFAPRRCHEMWVPFVDLRGHVFNNSTFAANAGAGIRYVNSSIAWGINSYYDYRSTDRFHYNQVSAGLEAIGSCWSLHINGYLPIGKKQSDYFDPVLTGLFTTPSFAFFQGNNFFLNLSGTQALAAKQEFTFKGIDANASFRMLKKSFFSLDFGMGPYYYQGSYEKFAAGGKANITARFTDYVAIRLNGSYDNLFRQRGQAEFAVSVPFGRRSFSKKCSSSTPVETVPSFFDSRLAKGPERSEIIVLDQERKTLATAAGGGTVVAIDPLTGLPYVIWFVNNLSHSAGTFESPFPTIQEALAVAQPNDIIYVYEGDGTPYDASITLLDDQMLLGSGIAHVVETQLGAISLPAQTEGVPTVENTMGATMITVANRNTISGFDLLVLSAGNTVDASGIESLSFLNNSYSTSVTDAMNSLAFTNCSGTLLIQNNQFIMASGDMGSSGIVLNDGGSESSLLSVFGNTFTNQANRGISLTYTGSSSPILNISNGNIFTAPTGVAGTNAIDVITSGSTVLASSISNQNTFSGYTGDVIHLDWSGSGSHNLTITGNSISSDASIASTNGINLVTNTDGSTSSSLTVLNNQFIDQSNIGINCFAGTNAVFHFDIENNTITGTSNAAANGIQVNANSAATANGTVAYNTCSHHANEGISMFVSDAATISALIDHNTLIVPENLGGLVGIEVSADNSSVVSSFYTVTNNTCSGHVNANIQSFPNGSTEITLDISNNTLTSASAGIAGLNNYGVEVGPGNTCHLVSATLANNSWTGPSTYEAGTTPQAFQVGLGDTSTISLLTVLGNTAILPFTAYQANTSPVGITVGAFTGSTITNVLISNNTVTFPNSTYQSTASPNGIELNTNGTGAIVAGTISDNRINFGPLNDPSLTDFFPNGIQINSSDMATIGTSMAPLLAEENIVQQIGGGGINFFSANSSSIHATIDHNTVIAAQNGANAGGISMNTADASMGFYTVTNNTCSGHTNASISSYPNGTSQISLNISDNLLSAATDGVSTASALAVQIAPSGNSTLLSVMISGNTYTGPSTYQPNDTPDGIQVNIGDNTIGAAPTGSNITITGNRINLPFTAYQTNTGPVGIQLGAYGAGTMTGAVISNNTITYPNSTYLDNTDPQGIQVSVSNNPPSPQAPFMPGASMQDVTVIQNTITFAPLTTTFTNFGTTGISANANDPNTTMGTLVSPILVTQNIVTRAEETGINLGSNSVNDVYMTASANSVSLGTVMGDAIGIIWDAGGTGKFLGDIDGNTIEGNNAGFFGALAISSSSNCQQASIQNNTITNIHSTNMSIPLPGLNLGGGIGTVPLSSGNLTVLIKNNALSGNTPQGTLSLVSSELGETADLCLTFDGNHGVGAQSPDGYTLYVDTAPPVPTLSYYDAGTNTGAFTFIPSMADVTPLGAPCPDCP